MTRWYARADRLMSLRQIAHVRAERDVMRNTSHDNQWLVPLYSSFDDDTYLYLVMHFLPGGDLVSPLSPSLPPPAPAPGPVNYGALGECI